MKKNISKKLSKVTIFLVAFVALSMVFTIYQTSINSTLNETLDGTDLSIGNESPNVAFAGGGNAGTQQSKTVSISSGTYSYSVDLSCASGNLERYWTTDKDHTTVSASYSSTSWYFGGTNTHSGDDYAISIMRFDLGDRIGRLASAGYVTVTFSATIKVSDNGGTVRAGIGSSSTSNSSRYVSSYSDAWSGIANGFSGTTKHAYKQSTSTSGETVSCSGSTLAGQYMYLAVGVMDPSWAFSTFNMSSMKMTINVTDKTAPSVSSGWQTTNTTSVTDSGGLHSVTTTQYDLSGNSVGTLTTAAFSASGRSATKSHSITFPTYGKYVITAVDNAGNSSSQTLWYYIAEITLSANDAAYGLVDLHNTNNYSLATAGTSVSITGSNYTLIANSAYYLYAAANENYFFTGFTNSSSQTAGTLSYYTQFGNYYVWRQDQTIPSPPKGSVFNWTANFEAVYGALQYLGADGSYKNFTSTSTSFSFAYNGEAQKYFQTKSGYYATFHYWGTTSAGTAYASEASPTETLPTYAGSYNVLVKMRYGSTSGNITGFAKYTFTITKLAIVAKPYILDKVYDKTNIATQGKTGTGADATAWTYHENTDSVAKTVAEKDGIGWKTRDGVYFTFANERAGTAAKTITINLPDTVTDGLAADLTTTKTSNTADILASYTLSTISTGVTATIKPKELKVSLGEYVNTLPSTIYVAGETITSHSYIGKVYDKTSNHYISGLVFDGIVDGDTIRISKTSSGTTILANDTGNSAGFACSSTNSLKSVTSEKLALTGGAHTNYTLNLYSAGAWSGANADVPYDGSQFELTMNGILISQAPIQIAIAPNSNTNKTYDGSVSLGTSAVTISLDINGSGFKTIGENADQVTIDTVTGVNVTLDDASANCYVEGENKSFIGSLKTITASGYTLANAGSDDVKGNYYLVNPSVTLNSEEYNDTNVGNYSCFLVYTRLINVSVNVTDKVYDGTNVMYNEGGDPLLSASVATTNENGIIISNGGIIPSDEDKIRITMARPTYGNDVVAVGSYSVSTTITLLGTDSDTATYKNYHLKGDSDDELTADTTGKEITINGITSSITQKPFTHADVSATLSATSFNYDLDSHKPTPTVTDAKVANTKATLVNDTDYSYAYYVSGTTTAPITGDIVNAGSYDVIITAKGNYSGELTLNYVINKSQVEVEVKDVISIIYGNSYFTTNDNGANYFHESFNASTDRLIVTTNVNNDSDAIKGNWYYNQVLDDYPTVGTHTLKVRFAIDTTDGYDDNYDYVAGTTGITVSLVVAKRPITLTIANQSMTFGENPTANFKYMSSQSAFALKEGSLGLVGGATLADFGTLVCDVTSKTYPSSVSGINSTTASSLLMAGTYAISPKGDVNALEGTLVPNYDYTWENGTFTVAQRNVEFRISAGISKIYGEADPSFAYDPNATTPITHATNLVVENNDNLQLFLVGALSRAEGEDVGSYDYKAHTLRPDAKESYTVADYVAYYNVINYNFTSFVIAGTAQDPVQFSITPREIYFDLSAYVDESIFGDEIVINSYNFEIKNDYVGEADSLVNGDTIKDDFPEFKIIRTDKTTGNDATETITVGVYDLTLRYKVGESYSDVAIGSQSPTTALNANYSVYATEGSWTITKRPIIVAPNNQNIIKTYSEKDPATIAHPSSYTATYNGDSTKNAIVDGYSLNGGLSRVSGEDVGFYLFTQGEVTGANNPNYSITFDNSVEYGLTINPLYVSLKPTDTRTGYANIYNAVTYNDSPRVTIDSIESKTEFIRTLFTATPNPVNNQYGTDEITALGLVVDGAGIKDKIVGAGGGFILPKEYDHHGLGYNTYPTAVGMYDLKLNAVTNGDQFKNYTFTVQQIETLGSFEVQPLQAKIIPWNYDAKDGKFSITYGDPIPELTYKAVDPTNTSVEIDIDNFTGNLKVSGETNADGHFIVGNTHRIVNDSITSDNYHVTVDESVAFTVTPKAVNVSLNGVDSTTNTIKVIYGNAEPIITLLDESTDGDAFFPYTFSINGLVPSVTTGKVDYSPFAYTLTQKVALARANSDVKICGTYAITLGTVESRNANYTYSLDKDYYLEIIPRPLTVTPTQGLNSYYGDSISSDVAYASAYTTLYNSNEYALNGEEYTVLDSDSLENVSTTIALSKDSSDNWMVRVAGMSSAVLFQDAMGNATQTLDGELYVYENGNKLFTFTFTEQNGSLQFNIVANKDNLNTSDYDGSYNYYLNRRSLITSDVLGGQLTVVWVKDSVGYSDITAPVGEYAYNLGTLSSSNYTLVLDAASPKYNVVKRPLIVKLNSMVEITFGDVVDIISNYTVYELGEYESSHAPVVYFTVPSGILTPGYYPITLNTARVEAENPNFAISFNDSEYVEYLVVYKKDITLTPATNQAKEYMEELDKLTFEVDGDFVTGFVPSENAFELFLSGVDDTTNAAPGTYDFLFQVNTETFTYDGDKTITLEECYNVNTNYKDALNNTIKYSITPKQATFKIVYTTDKDGTEVTKELLIDKDQNTSVVHQIKLLDYTAAAQTVKIELVTGATYHNDSVAGKISTYYEGDFMDIVSASGNELYLKDASTYYFEISTEPEDGNFLSYFTKASTTIEVVVGKRSLAEINPSTHVKVQKTYGEADPSFTFDIKSPYGEELMGTLKREVGEDVGTYALTRDTVSNKDGSENTNYVIALKDSVFTIVPKEITLTPAAIVGATKTYGDSDSEIYEDVATGINNEVLRVIYSRVAGENAGNYDLSINLVACLTTDEFGENVAVKDEFGAYVENTNYTVTLAENAGDAKYLIKKRAASVVANGISKVFDGEPVDLSTLSYEVSGVLEDESLVGSITIVSGAPVVVGSYKIELVGFDAAENDNYEVATTNAYCVITPAPISIKADNVSYEYGDTPAPFTYTVTGTVYDGYPLEGELESLGERPSMGAHVIKAGTLDNKEGRNPNYAITFVSGGVCTVNARHITIQVTESVSQVYGDELTAIPFEVVSANGLIPGDSLKGNLAPTGTNVNLEGYDITIGNVQELNTNYVIELDTNGAKYVITPRPITVTAEAKSTVYGYPTEALSYIAEGLIGEDTLEGELECALGTNVGEYTINQGTLYNANYEIVTYNAAKYSITPRAITITIKDAESEYGQEEAELSYYISKGDLLEGDDLNVTLSREAGDAMGTYAIGGTYDNDNYSVEFILGTYTIHKYRAVITVETEYITFIEDGDARSIVAECSSGAEIIFTVKGEEVTNYFRHAGKYTVELTAPETDNYYAPETVYVYITINRPVLKTESSGIDVTLTTESGFDPNLSIEMEKLPTDYMDMVAELTSKQKIVRAFTLTSINESGLIDEVEGKTTVTIKVPTMLSEEKVVQVLVREDGVYNVVDVEVIDGYVTLEVDSLSSFAFITEENNNYLVLILIGVAALIMLGSVMVFLFRKRA